MDSVVASVVVAVAEDSAVAVSAAASHPEAVMFPGVAVQALLASLRQAPNAHRKRRTERIDSRTWQKNKPRVLMLKNLADEQ